MVRYVISGTIAVLCDFSVYRILLSILGFDFLHFCNAAGLVSGFLVSFALNRNWSFQSSGHPGKQLLLSLGLLIFNSWFTGALLVFMVQTLQWNPSHSKLVTQFLVISWNYLFFRYVVYRR